MASAKKNVISLTDDDFKGKTFKVAPAGKYTAKFSMKSKIKSGEHGPIAEVIVTLRKDARGKVVKDINVFDNIAPHVGWKVAQVLKALGIKKKSLTLEQFIALLKGKAVRVIIKLAKYNGKKKNEVVQYLPMNAAEGEEDADEDSLGDDDVEDEDDEEDDEDEDDDADDDEDDDDEDEDEDDEDEDADEDDEDEDDDDADDDEEDDEEEDDEDEDDDDDDEEEEDDEDDQKPVKKAAKKKAPVKKTAPVKKAPVKKTAAKKPVAKKSGGARR